MRLLRVKLRVGNLCSLTETVLVMDKQSFVSIGQLAKRFKLSRSTLLYYERIGLLVASNRSSAGYRQYSSDDIAKLESILFFRSTGLSLVQLEKLVQPNKLSLKAQPFQQILQQRLNQINTDIDELRSQQKILIELLHNDLSTTSTQKIDKKIWSEMLRDAGLDENGMQEWHRQFEKRAPIEHHKFLASLGLAAKEIQSIRENSKTE